MKKIMMVAMICASTVVCLVTGCAVMEAVGLVKCVGCQTIPSRYYETEDGYVCEKCLCSECRQGVYVKAFKTPYHHNNIYECRLCRVCLEKLEKKGIALDCLSKGHDVRLECEFDESDPNHWIHWDDDDEDADPRPNVRVRYDIFVESCAECDAARRETELAERKERERIAEEKRRQEQAEWEARKEKERIRKAEEAAAERRRRNEFADRMREKYGCTPSYGTTISPSISPDIGRAYRLNRDCKFTITQFFSKDTATLTDSLVNVVTKDKDDSVKVIVRCSTNDGWDSSQREYCIKIIDSKHSYVDGDSLADGWYKYVGVEGFVGSRIHAFEEIECP